MRSTRTPFARRRGRRRTVLAATGLVAALALTVTACNDNDSGDNKASDKSGATASSAGGDGGKIKIPADIAGKLKEHGIDVDN